jgi:Ni/Co efflux regulator RcnB
MKKLLASALALGLGVLLASPVDAQDRGRDGHRDRDRDHSSWNDRDRHDRDGRWDRDGRRDRDRWDNDRWDGDRHAKHWDGRDRHDWRDGRRDRWEYRRYRAPARYVYPRGYYDYRWSVGHRLPSSYYGRSYYIDHRAYRLDPPPYGYRWVRVDNDVFLVALASGLISHAIHDLFYY